MQSGVYCNSSLKHHFPLVPLMMVLVTKTAGVNGENKTACAAAPLSLQQKELKLTDLLTNRVVVISIPMCQWLD